jgi:signal transduction histidine kinase/CheY-like chemotaxis protein
MKGKSKKCLTGEGVKEQRRIDHQIIRQLFDDYLRMYASRDDRLTEFFSEDFSGITGSGDELTKDLDEWIAITRQDFAQVKDPLRIELKDLVTQSLSDTIAVATSTFMIHLPIKDLILSHKTVRLVLIFRKESAGWKICHCSFSVPFATVQEGEVYPLQEIEERNKLLEELITERTQELSTAKKAAEAATIAKSQFLAVMSHEIRTPINALVGFSSLARSTIDPVKLGQYHAILEQSSRSLMELVDDILDMSKIEAGRMEYEAVPFNLRQLLTSLEEQYQHLAARKVLLFHVTVHDNVPAWILGDPVRLRQILSNLLANAIKFTDSGGVSLSISTGNGDMGKGQPMLRFEVRDTGIGIPESSLDLLFQPFRQLDSTITRKFGGTGLGLAIVHNLVTMMRGTISVDSREGDGSCFVVELPLLATEQLPAELSAPPVILAQGLVLVVEDNEFNRRLLKDHLTSWGQEVLLAEDGWQALQLLEQQRFDLILLDIRMPGIDGFEVATLIRQQELERSEKPVPIIAITADAGTTTREACLNAGINAILAKPVLPEQLARAIAAHCGGAMVSPLGSELLNPQARNDLGSDPERARQYWELLLQDIEEELQSLQTALAEDDRNRLGRAAHSLKGLCGNLANSEPAELAAWLQQHASAIGTEQLRLVAEQLRTACKRVLAQDNTP